MRQPILLFVILFSCFAQASYSQPNPSTFRETFLDAEYFLVYEKYDEALFSYNTLYKNGYSESANINYRIGQCYLNLPGEKERAIPYFEKATKNTSKNYVEGSFLETKAPQDAFYFLGNAYLIDHQFDKAIQSYKTYRLLLQPGNNAARRLVKKELDACDLARQWIENPLKVTITNLGRPVSTSARDYLPVISGDETVLIYNSSQQFYQAIFMSKKVDGKWTTPVNITPDVQSDGNQFVSSISYDGKELYLRKEEVFDADIAVAKFEDGHWTKSKLLGKTINSKSWEGNACVTKDGKTLYFSSNRSGGSGLLDIYKSELKNGSWGPAINLGDVINTEYSEDAPFISEDGNRLYFASQGHKGIGGYDIFYSDKKADGTWSEPVNLGYPINTTGDDDFLCPAANGKVGYLARYSKDGYGSEDIFMVPLVAAKDSIPAK
jgi:tetratricopeptide (TPR) repeat protein